MGRVIGIDLGTTNSCVALVDGSENIVLTNAEGARTTPSVVGFNEAGERLVGQQAKRQVVIHPDRTVYRVKRLMGRRFADADIRETAEHVGYNIVAHTNGDAWVEVAGSTYSPSEISAFILQKMRVTAEEYIGEPVTDAVITVPAYFSDAQRQATRDAGQIAGLNVLRIMNEPTAAALAYGFNKDKDCTIVVIDLGGGTFDVSILAIRGGLYEVISTSGDNTLGGEDFDVMILRYLADRFEEETGIDIRQDTMAMQRLREAAETAKCELSSLNETTINLPFLAVDASGPRHLSEVLSRLKMEELCAELIERIEGPCKVALEDAGLSEGDVEEVLLVGGMSRMPAIQQSVHDIFGVKPVRAINPDEAIALGACIQGGILGGQVQETILLDVTPFSLGIRTRGDRMSVVIPRNTSIPIEETKTYATTEDSQEMVVLEVLQGEDELASNNKSLGTFTLGDLPQRPAGKVKVQVSFEIDSDGIVHVSARDLETKRESRITIDDGGGLTEAEREAAYARVNG